MTRDDIIQWAREAARQPDRRYDPDEVEFMEALASLVASATRRRYQAEVERWKAEAATAEKWRGMALSHAAVGLAPDAASTVQEIRREAAAAEREACAELCDAQHDRARTSPGAMRADACASAIRARKDSA